MAEQDIHTRLDELIAFDVAVLNAGATTTGNIIDTLNFEGIEFAMFTGAFTDGTYDLTILQSDDDAMAGATTAAGERELIGTPTQLTAANEITRLGYIGKFRFVQAAIVSTTGGTGATVGATVIRGEPKHMPVADQ